MSRTAGQPGTLFGRLEVIGRAPASDRGASRVWVRCACGTEKIMHRSNLLRGHRYNVDQSCGCARRAILIPDTDPKPAINQYADLFKKVGAPNKLSESE